LDTIHFPGGGYAADHPIGPEWTTRGRRPSIGAMGHLPALLVDAMQCAGDIRIRRPGPHAVPCITKRGPKKRRTCFHLAGGTGRSLLQGSGLHRQG